MPSDLDIFGKLLTASFRGVEFYTGNSDFSFDHDQAIHKFPDRDGALVEATGRNPAKHKFTAIMRNGIAGSAITQYPTNWRLLMAAMADKSTGTLVDPELGPIKVKPCSQSTPRNVMQRDGVDVALEFIESPEAEEELSALLKQASPMGSAVAMARDLDNALGNVNPEPEMPESLSPSLLESMKQLSGALASFKLGIGNILGQFDAVIGGLYELHDAILGADNPQNTAVIAQIRAMIDALTRAQVSATPKNKPVTLATVPRDSQLDAVAAFFGTGLSDFLKLNPMLADSQTVKAGATVVVFA